MPERKHKTEQNPVETPEPDAPAPESNGVADPAPATEVAASGAFVEPQIVEAVPADHPAIDNNPREGTTAGQNAADFNDPRHLTPNDPEFAGQGLDLSVYGDPAASTETKAG